MKTISKHLKSKWTKCNITNLIAFTPIFVMEANPFKLITYYK